MGGQRGWRGGLAWAVAGLVLLSSGCGGEEEEGGVPGAFPDPRPRPPRAHLCNCPYSLGIPGNAERFPDGKFWTQRPAPVGKEARLEDMLAAYSFNRTVLVMMVNAGEIDLLENYVCSMLRVGVNKYVVVAVDSKAHELLVARNIPAVHDPGLLGALPAEDGHFNSVDWKALVQAKLLVAQRVLRLDYNLIFTDVDIALRSNVLDELMALPADASFLRDDMNEKKKEVNTGFYFLRATQQNKELFRRALGAKTKYKDWDDQKLVNYVITKNKGGDGKLKNYLPVPAYSNGCTLKKLTEEQFTAVKAVHANCSTNKKAKFQMLCEHRLWFCGHVGGFIRRKVGGMAVRIRCDQTRWQRVAKQAARQAFDNHFSDD